MAKHDHDGDGHGTETPDVSHIKNVDVVHETSDVNVPALLKFVLALTILTAVVYLLMLFLFNFLNKQETKNEPPPGPMAMSERESLPPEPRLQSAPGFAEDLSKSMTDAHPDKPKDPLWEIHILRQQWQNALNEGAKDSTGRVVGIPIEDAMKRVVTASASASGTGNVAGYGEELPTAASSGRVSMKGRQ